MAEIKFTIIGEPATQQRFRAAATKKGIRTYKTRSQKAGERWIGIQMLQHAPEYLLTGPLSLTARLFRSIPASWSKEKKDDARNGRIRPTSVPDLSNLIKNVEDVGNKILWRDDAQIVDFGDSGKWYSDRPRTEIIVKELLL